MKVILTQEVKGKGGEGDVVDVARGYAVNYLFPRKMAIEATSGNLKQLEHRMHNIRTREEARLGGAEAIAAALQGKKVTLFAKVGEGGRLFGSITAPMIVDAIDEQLDVEVDRRKMDVHGHIKEIGEHPVTVQVYRDVKAEVIVKVVAEGTEVAEESPAVETAQPEVADDFDGDADVEVAAEEADELDVDEAADPAADEVAGEEAAGEPEAE